MVCVLSVYDNKSSLSEILKKKKKSLPEVRDAFTSRASVVVPFKCKEATLRGKADTISFNMEMIAAKDSQLAVFDQCMGQNLSSIPSTYGEDLKY
jgi:hypothetical protein